MRLILGDSLEKLKELEDNSVDSIVTDPPYGLSFMGRKWDYDVPSQEIWEECLRVLKPGGYLLAFAGTRTQHRMAVRIEDAGFEIRDMIAWVYGSGFPKSLNIGKAIDKLQGNKNKELPTIPMQEKGEVGEISKNRRCAICKLPLASANPCKCDRQYKANNDWTGFGTSLKPALEPITVARKPISEKTVAENVLKYGTGGINIDGCRVGTEQVQTTAHKTLGDGIKYGKSKPFEASEMRTGRFPANLITDGSDEVVGLFPESKSGNGKANTYEKEGGQWGNGKQIRNADFGDSGSASRFFQKCEFDNECFLCYNTLHRANINENICNNTNVSGVKKNLKTTQVIKENTAPLNVEDLQDDKLVQLVKSVENLCQKCEIGFVQNLAVISESQKDLESQEELQVIQDFTTNSKKCILLQNLVSFAEKMDSIDTTLTTTSLLKLFGSVNRVITNYTQEIEKSEQKRFLYCPKASKSERNKGVDSIVSIVIEYSIWKDINTTQQVKKVQLLVDMDKSVQKVIGVSGTESKNATEWNTMLFGNCTMEQFQKVNKSITKTTTNLITTSTILNWLTHLLTNDYTADVNYETENGGNLVENVANYNTLITTINEKMVSALGVNNVVLGTQLKISVKEGSNIHSTVKPISLMRYLCRLVTPKGGTVLDPFMGSGTTGIGAKLEGFDFIGIEREAEYIKIAEARINAWQKDNKLL